MLKAKTLAASFFAISFVAFLLLQLVLYKQHATEASWLYAKEAIGVATVDDDRMLGAICNSAGRPKCAIRLFHKVLHSDAQNLEAMANLGINYAILGQYEKARPYLKLYFASGGSGFESSKWYAQVLEMLDARDEAVDWYYHLVSHNPGFEMAARRLIDLLVKQNRNFEAVSVIDHVLRLYPTYAEKQKRLIARLIEEEVKERKIATAETEPSAAMQVTLRIPSFDGRQFRMPQITKKGLHFIAVRDDVSKSQLRVEDIVKFGLDFTKTGLNKGRISNIKFGDLKIENIDVDLCEACDTYLGSRPFIEQGARVDTKGRMAFLVIR